MTPKGYVCVLIPETVTITLYGKRCEEIKLLERRNLLCIIQVGPKSNDSVLVRERWGSFEIHKRRKHRHTEEKVMGRQRPRLKGDQRQFLLDVFFLRIK